MTSPDYKRLARFIRRNYANVASTLALFVALTGVGLVQAGVIVTSKQIKNGTILSQDIHKGGVNSSDLKNGGVHPADVTMPEPEQIADQGHTVEVGTAYALADEAGTYTKEDATSKLEVEWIGTARAEFSGCVFQIRVNGQPASAQGGGEVFVENGSTWSGSTSALFEGLGAGPVKIEVWARAIIESNVGYPCTVGPAETIPQHFVVSEQVL